MLKTEFVNTSIVTMEMSNLQWFLYSFGIIVIGILILHMLKELNRRKGGGILNHSIVNFTRFAREEERIFLFFDLASSTEIAEKLGHVQYSAFLQDCFRDINWYVHETHASIYQIIGDEVVLTWKCSREQNYKYAIDFYFLFTTNLKKYQEYFLNTYKFIPHFKAAINAGKIMRLEQGLFKSNLAYHGDVINTAARLQKLCKNYAYPILATEEFVKKKKLLCDSYAVTFIDQVIIHGKKEKVGIYGLDSLYNDEIYQPFRPC